MDLLSKATEVAKSLGMTDQGEEEKAEEKVETKEESTEEETVEEEAEEETQEEESSGRTPQSVPYKRFSEIYGRYKELERLTTALLQGQQKQTDSRTEKEPQKLPDFDTMSPSETVKWTLQAVAALVEDKVGRSVKPLQESVAVREASVEIEKVAAAHPDYWTHYEKMYDLAQRHPTLSAEEVYFLATGNKKALLKSVSDGLKKKVGQKKDAQTETRSTSAGKQTEVKTFKTVRDAALDVAKKLGMS